MYFYGLIILNFYTGLFMIFCNGEWTGENRKYLNISFVSVVISFLVLQIVLGIFFHIRGKVLPGMLIATSFFQNIILFLAVLMPAFYLRKENGNPAALLGFNKFEKRFVPLIIISYALLIFGNGLLAWISSLVMEHFGEKPELQFLVKYAAECDIAILCVIAFYTVICAPIIEELIFRHIFFGVLKNALGLPVSMIFVSLFFALLHFSPVFFLPLFFMGLLLQYVYLRTKGVTAPIILHALYNLFSFVNILLLRFFDINPELFL